MEKVYLRKLIHISIISILLIEVVFGKHITLALISLVTIIFFISEILRTRKISFPIIQDITLLCEEKKKLRKISMEPIYLALGIFILLFLFPQRSFYIGTIAVIVGDGFAGLVGKSFGKNKIIYNRNKTIEGSIAFFFTTFLAYIFFLNFLDALIFSTIGAILESFFRKSDNFFLPILIGAVSVFI